MNDTNNVLMILLVLIIGIPLGILVITVFIKGEIKEKEKRTLTSAQENYNNNHQNDFESSKKNYYRLIKEKGKTWEEVQASKNTRNQERSSGIYAMYLKTENIQETIPVYIGQSKDIFKRWRQHQNQISKVVREESNTRTYKKILHYISLKGLKIQDLNFVVLVKCNEKKLNQEEKKYIDFFKSDVFGFNATKGNK